MSGDDISRTFKRCRSAINIHDPILIKIAREINLAETLLIQYLKEVNDNLKSNVSEKVALENLSKLVVRELEYLRKVKRSEIVNMSGSFVTFRSDDGEFLVTVVPEEELQRSCQSLLSLSNVKPRFATPVVSKERFVTPSQSIESVYYDAYNDLPCEIPEVPSGSSSFGRSIHSMLSYIFASTIGRMEASDQKYS